MINTKWKSLNTNSTLLVTLRFLKMKDAYVLDVWETLVDTPEWGVLLKEDPELNALSERAKTDVPSKRRLVEIFDAKAQAGELTRVEVPDTRSVLERLASKGSLVAFSSGSNFTNQALLEAAGFKDYFDPSMIISDADTLKVSKADPTAYKSLADYLQTHDLKPILFVDNTERNVAAAGKSGIIPSLYHFDRTASGLLVPQQMDGYTKIGNLNQMKELGK